MFFSHILCQRTLLSENTVETKIKEIESNSAAINTWIVRT